VSKFEITDIQGVGPETAAVLAEHGIRTVEELAGLSTAALLAVPGFGPARAATVMAAATRLLDQSVSDGSAAAGDQAFTVDAGKAKRKRRDGKKPSGKAKRKDGKPKKNKKDKAKKRAKAKQRDKAESAAKGKKHQKRKGKQKGKRKKK